MTIDTLSLDIKADSSAAVTSINNLKEALSKLRDCAKGKTFNNLGESVKNLFESLDSISEESIARVERLSSALEKLSHVKISSTFKNIPNTVKTLNFNTMNTPLDSGKNMPDASGIENVTEKIKKTTEGAKDKFKELEKVAQKVSKNIKSQFNNIAKSIFSLTPPLKKIMSTFMRIAFYRLIRSLIKTITSGIKEGLDNLALYSASINSTDASKANYNLSRLATAFFQLKNTIGSLVGTIVQQFTPAVVDMINVCIRAVNVINQLISAMMGKTTYSRAKEVWIDYASTLDKTKKSAGALHHQLAQFDELNNLTPGGGGGATELDPSSFFEEVEIAQKWIEAAEKLKSIFKDIFWYSLAIGSIIAGWNLAKGFLGLTGGLPLAATPIRVAGTLFITGIFLTIAGTILSWSAFLDSLEKGIDAKVALKLSLGGILGIAGGSLMALGGGFLAQGMLIPLGAALTLVGTPIFASAFLDMFTNGLSIANTSFTITGASILLAGLGAIIGSIAGPLGSAFGGIIGSLLGAVLGGLTVLVAYFTTNYDKIHQKTVDFLDNLGLHKLADIVDDAFNECKPYIDKFLQIIKDIKDGLIGIKEAFVEAKDKLLETGDIQAAWETLTTNLSNAFTKMKQSIGGDLEAIKDKIMQIINDIPLLKFIAEAFDPTFGKNQSQNNAFLEKSKSKSTPHAYIHAYATGGFVPNGDLFIANENSPELVGSIGGRTAVANNDMITSAIATATYNAMSKALSENNGNVRIVVEGDSDGIFKVWQKKQREYQKATGLAY